MNIQQLQEIIFLKIKKGIDERNSAYPTFNMNYWQGFCNGVEERAGLNNDDIWQVVKKNVIDYCDKLRRKHGTMNPIDFIK